MLSRVVYKKRRGRRMATALATLALVTGTFVFAGTALAVHDDTFQLDGDTTTTGFSLPAPGTQSRDWDSLFNADGTSTSVIDPTNTTGFTNGDFVRDFRIKVSRTDCSLTATTPLTFCTSDTTTFATGSKDTLNISPGWQCNTDNNVNSKIDIMNAYAAAFTAANGDKLLYFGLDKNKDNGNNNVGFWFLQSNADCDASNGTAAWSGTHVDGDVLVVSAFTSGGGVSNITAYRWAGGANGCIDSGGDANRCDGLSFGQGGDCKTTSGRDNICATTNSSALPFNSNVTSKWLTSDATLGVGHTVVPPDFFEGGINLTKIFAASGGDTPPSCFNTFIGDTRSSQSLTATLFDFARGQLGECTQTLTTSAAGTANGSIGTGSVSSGTDTATLTVTGTPTWGGTLTWYLCGPVATDACDNTKGLQVTSRTVNQSSPAADFVSGTATLTSVGRYCWTAHFEPNQASKDAGLVAKDDTGVGECFTVSPVKPILSTQASCTGNPCILGTDTLSDKAFLSGTANQPGSGGPSTTYPTINPATAGAPAGGTITWALYGPTNGGCTDTKATSPLTATVSGDNTTTGYGPTTYKPALADGVGTYTFVANYAGSTPNTSAADAVTCAAPGANETITVGGSASIASKQRWLPNDRVTVAGDSALNGTLTVTLYPTNDCTGTAVTGQSYSTTFTNATSPQVFNTSNSSFFVGTKSDGTAGGAAGSYSWKVHYVDSNLSSPTDQCETSTVSPITDKP